MLFPLGIPLQHFKSGSLLDLYFFFFCRSLADVSVLLGSLSCWNIYFQFNSNCLTDGLRIIFNSLIWCRIRGWINELLSPTGSLFPVGRNAANLPLCRVEHFYSVWAELKVSWCVVAAASGGWIQRHGRHRSLHSRGSKDVEWRWSYFRRFIGVKSTPGL